MSSRQYTADGRRGRLKPVPRLLSIIYRDTRGQSLLMQAILVVPVLLLAIGLVYDLGAVAVAQTRAQDVVDLAVQDAAKYINWSTFYATQEIVLMNEAVTVAQLRVDEYSNGQVQLLTLNVIPYEINGKHFQGIYMLGEVEIPMRYLHMLGLPTITRRVQALAVPAYGIESAGN